jgi:O-antigen ligase
MEKFNVKGFPPRQFLLGKVRRIPPKNIIPITLVVCAAVIQSVAILALGIKSFPLIFFVILILPWLMQDAFRLFIFLIITWPILTLYVRVPLPAGIPDLSYDRALVLLLLGIILIEALVSRRKLKKGTTLDALVIFYVIAQITARISVIWFGGVGNPDLNGFFDSVLIPIGLYWMVKNLLGSRTQLQWILLMFVIASIIVCPTGLYEQMVGTRIFKASLSLGGSEIVYQWQDAEGGLRAAGALANPAIYGAVLGMGSLAGMCSLSFIKRKSVQLVLIGSIVVLLYGVLASYTRSAWLSVFVVLFMAQFLIGDLWKKTIPIVLSGSLFLFTLWNLIPDSAKILQRALTTKTITQRLDLYSIGWSQFLKKPILGWGAGALNVFDLSGAGEISHNTYLTLLVDGGLVLFLSFIAVVGYLLIRSIHIYRFTKKGSLEKNVLIAMIGSILIFFLSGMALELRYFGYFNSLFWICAGVVDYLAISLNKLTDL